MPNAAALQTRANDVGKTLWGALRAVDVPATVADLHRRSGARPRTISQALWRWHKAGFLERLPSEPPRYAIAPDWEHLAEAPTIGSLSADAWRALRRLGRSATFEEVLAASGCADRPLYCRLRRWAKAGYVIKFEAQSERYLLLADARDAPPPVLSRTNEVSERKSTQGERMWKAIRILRTFDIPMLLIAAEARRRSCDKFIICLEQAGIIRRISRNYSSGAGSSPGGPPLTRKGWSTFRLARDLGPKAPKITERKDRGGGRCLIDMNSGQSFEMKPMRAVGDAGTNHGR